MRYDQVRELLLHHLRWSGADEDKAREIYHDDAILEFPQSGERAQGRGDLWIAEGRISYEGGDPINYLWVAQFRGDLPAHVRAGSGDS